MRVAFVAGTECEQSLLGEAPQKRSRLLGCNPRRPATERTAAGRGREGEEAFQSPTKKPRDSSQDHAAHSHAGIGRLRGVGNCYMPYAAKGRSMTTAAERCTGFAI